MAELAYIEKIFLLILTLILVIIITSAISYFIQRILKKKDIFKTLFEINCKYYSVYINYNFSLLH